MRKAVFIILAVCLVFAVFASTFYFTGNSMPNTEEQATSSANDETVSKIVIWNKNRDQKVFETTDTATLNAFIQLMNNASWSSGPEPLPSLEGTEYILAVYDKNGQSTQYTIYYQSNNDITLFKTKSDENRSYEKADFPAKSGGFSLGDYLKINNVQ